MQQPLPTGVPALTTPRFYVTGRQPLRLSAILLAIVVASIALSSVLYALRHNGHAHLTSGVDRASSSTPGATPDDDKDDPNQIDTIVLGDPADAPVPAKRGDHVSPVHPFVIVHLPRWGDQVGLIPDSPAGHLLYNWLAAFNQSNDSALASALPNDAPAFSVAAQMELRHETGGFNLLSAKEVQPGILVFRLRDQTPEANEVLGTLQVRANSNPAAIATFSLRAVPATPKDATTTVAPTH
ncbi:hypothetical protein [Edaphobacter flagellatus]|uniref:hypothetical protein n=1 Tax=Edaphobacter flagellatus TaxID=1933044 RepID=UPI0021B1653B|nr:hypothetical protein [Edaphobacter flagellatus]